MRRGEAVCVCVCVKCVREVYVCVSIFNSVSFIMHVISCFSILALAIVQTETIIKGKNITDRYIHKKNSTS